MKKSQLLVLYQAVKGTEGVLNLAESRQRDAFLKPLTEATQTFEQDRKTIFEKFCDKKEDGTPDVTNDLYSFSAEVQKDLNAELNTLLQESVTLECPESLADWLERTEYRPKAGETAVLDEIIENL